MILAVYMELGFSLRPQSENKILFLLRGEFNPFRFIGVKNYVWSYKLYYFLFSFIFSPTGYTIFFVCVCVLEVGEGMCMYNSPDNHRCYFKV